MAQKCRQLFETLGKAFPQRGACSNLLRLKGSTRLLLTSKAVGLSPRVEISFSIQLNYKRGIPLEELPLPGPWDGICTEHNCNIAKQVPNSVGRHPKIQWRRTSMYRNSRRSLICLNPALLKDRTRAEASEKHPSSWSWEQRQDLSSR